MRLLIAAEYFPNPFKGYLDHQAAQFVRFGAQVSFLAFGHWGGEVQPTLAAAQPELDVRYVPLSASAPRSLAAGVAAAELGVLGG
jgi:hypothetical protein